MTWVKLDDQFPDNLKVERAGPQAAWLYVCALCYCARLLTDGWVPKTMIPRLSSLKGPQKLADRLASDDIGLFEDRGDNYYIPDYLDFNPSKEQVIKQRQVRAEAGRKGGSKSSSKRQANAYGFASDNVQPPSPSPTPLVKDISNNNILSRRLLEAGHPVEDVDVVVERIALRKLLGGEPIRDPLAFAEECIKRLSKGKNGTRSGEPVLIDGTAMRYVDGAWVDAE